MSAVASYPGQATGDMASAGRRVLESKIEQGRQGARALIEHVQSHVPVDAVVPGRLLHFEAPMDHDTAPPEPARRLRVIWHDSRNNVDVVQGVHKHALAQLAGKAGVPSSFVNELDASPEQWRKELAAEILNRHFHESREDRAEDASRKRYLARSINGEMRGFLSDKYRRIDSRPTLDAFVEEAMALGAVPYQGTVTDVRVSLRALLPVVFEPVPGEVVCFGAEWGNSDFGAAKHWCRVFMLRLMCLNGATLDDLLAQVHVGGRLHEDIEYSQRTMDLDTRANVSALRDIVRGALGPKRVQESLDVIRRANEQHVEWKGRATGLAARLTKGEMKLAKDAFESADVINLPPGRTAYRLSNALSWVANGEGVDPERKLDLQRAAGEVLTGKRESAAVEE